MKIAISGKGGVGKSTVSGTLARLYAADGHRVLAVDADPDANLASALGVPSSLRSQIHTISTERQLIEERTGAKVRQFGQMFKINPEVADIAGKYAIHYKGVDLLVLGAVQHAAGGCACPESVLLKSLVSHLVLRQGDVVILDMEAGIEHLGRGTAMGVDLMMAVIEPGQRSLETAERVRQMSADLGISRFGIVLNKTSQPEEDSRWIAGAFDPQLLLGVIPYDQRIASADRQGLGLADLGFPELLTPFRELQQKLQSYCTEKESVL
jgi:CO dehydrogenase maturation factor